MSEQEEIPNPLPGDAEVGEDMDSVESGQDDENSEEIDGEEE
jgi:hypothetical protein